MSLCLRRRRYLLGLSQFFYFVSSWVSKTPYPRFHLITPFPSHHPPSNERISIIITKNTRESMWATAQADSRLLFVCSLEKKKKETRIPKGCCVFHSLLLCCEFPNRWWVFICDLISSFFYVNLRKEKSENSAHFCGALKRCRVVHV